MATKRKVLIFVDHYLPGFKAGGPLRTLANIVEHLKDEFQFSVVCTNTDMDDPTPYPEIKSNEWNIRNDGTRVFYFSWNNLSYGSIRNLLKQEQFDVLHLDSLFTLPFCIYPLMYVKFNHANCKVILAPRGMLGKGSLAIKPLKKKIFFAITKTMGLYKPVIWHASTDSEIQEVKDMFGENASVLKAIDLTPVQKIETIRRIKKAGEADIACISRITPVKNITAIFRYLKNIDPANKVNLRMYGPIETPEYWEECEALIKQLGDNIKVEYKGSAKYEEVKPILNCHHFTILPTFNENFGHSIVESFASGCPAIISNRTPWKNLELKKVGWDIPLENENMFTGKINEACEMDQQTFDQWSDACYQFAKQIIFNQEAIEQNRKLFL